VKVLAFPGNTGEGLSTVEAGNFRLSSHVTRLPLFPSAPHLRPRRRQSTSARGFLSGLPAPKSSASAGGGGMFTTLPQPGPAAVAAKGGKRLVQFQVPTLDP